VLIKAFAKDPSSRIIDIGCGASTLLGELAADGYSDLTGLDASSVAIQRARSGLGKVADRITWITADITRWTPSRQWDLWHDRAVFHFLIEPETQLAYIRAMSSALEVGSTAIVATFALDGPDRCSGLPLQR
jgi:trans-aconitate methyltransferase